MSASLYRMFNKKRTFHHQNLHLESCVTKECINFLHWIESVCPVGGVKELQMNLMNMLHGFHKPDHSPGQIYVTMTAIISYYYKYKWPR